MSNATCIGHVGALAVALGVGIAVATTPAVGYAEPADSFTCSSPDSSQPDTTALILCGTACPTPDDAYIEVVKNQYIAPTHPGQHIDYVRGAHARGVLAPHGGPAPPRVRARAPDLFGLDGPVWPDEPWWKLSGLFDLTIDQSVQAGVADLETAMAVYGNDDVVIFGLSQGATIANVEKRKLAEQYPAGTTAPDIDFVLAVTPMCPTAASCGFPGLCIPILDWSFNGPEPTNTPFDTVVITRQYDAFADFPLYPLNVIADLNAVLGFIYVHMYDWTSACLPILRHRRLRGVSTATRVITSSRP